jgi:sorbitol/mannitol transport system permease protein
MQRRHRLSHLLATSLAAWTAAVVLFFPILWTALTSVKTELEAAASEPSFLHFHWTLENYAAVLRTGEYVPHALNSILISTLATVCAIALAIPAAWALAMVPTRRTRGILLWILSTKMMPAVGVLIPIYLIYQSLGLLNTRIGLIAIIGLSNLPIVVWMLFTYFKELPSEMLEAARMDGATPLQEIGLILLPTSLPALGSAFLLSFLLAWNECFWTLNLSTSDAAPLTVYIASFSSPEGLFWAKLSAASMLAMAPVFLIGWFCQRQLVRGLTFGAVK